MAIAIAQKIVYLNKNLVVLIVIIVHIVEIICVQQAQEHGFILITLRLGQLEAEQLLQHVMAVI